MLVGAAMAWHKALATAAKGGGGGEDAAGGLQR